jgi:hypothetical protein
MRYKEGRKKGEPATVRCSFMLDKDNVKTWESIKGKSRWINAQLCYLAEVQKELPNNLVE